MSRTRRPFPARGVLLALPALFLLAVAVPRPSHTRCMLANPGFKLPRSAGSGFNEWNQFGSVGSSTTATLGTVAARESGSDTGNWDVSGYWQNQDTVAVNLPHHPERTPFDQLFERHFDRYLGEHEERCEPRYIRAARRCATSSASWGTR